MSTFYDCPNCGANIADDGVSETARCRFCGTEIEIPRKRRAATRRELEAERDLILARDAEWQARMKETSRRGVEDVLVPPIGCCGIYFALFIVGSLILSAVGLKASEKHSTGMAAIVLAAAIIGAVLIIWRRETRRRERVLALERERLADLSYREERLRAIDEELKTLE